MFASELFDGDVKGIGNGDLRDDVSRRIIDEPIMDPDLVG